MLKVLIADDEPKIRRGLSEAVDWNSLNMEVCGFAQNGMRAVEEVQEKRPDICLVDICMPLLNGLDLIQKIKEISPDTLCIIITGFDEFEYAQKAVHLNAFDYILKPVNEEHLREALFRAKTVIEERRSVDRRMQQANDAFLKYRPFLQEQVLQEILLGNIEGKELEEEANLYEICFTHTIVLWRLDIRDMDEMPGQKILDRQLRQFVLRNISEEVLGRYGKVYMTFDDRDCLFAFLDMEEETCGKAKLELEATVAGCMKICLKSKTAVADSLEQVAEIYTNWEEEDEKHLSRITQEAKEILETCYQDQDLSVQEVAARCSVSQSYLSRLFRAEMGVGLNDYLTKVRMQKALLLLDKTDLRVYEIAEKVGYRSQHYFCVAFKKVLAVSPTDYRMNKNKED